MSQIESSQLISNTSNIAAIIRSSHRRCSVKKVFLEVSQNSGLRTAALLKRRL